MVVQGNEQERYYVTYTVALVQINAYRDRVLAAGPRMILQTLLGIPVH